jgi:hypothetical protein
MPEEATTTTATAEPPQSNEPESSGSGYVQSLIEPALDGDSRQALDDGKVATPPASEETTPATDEAKGPEEAPETPAKEARREELIQQYAKEWGVNPNDPNQRKALKRVADKELFIEHLKGQIASGKPAQEATATAGEPLTEFEKSLIAAADAETAPPARTETAPPPQTDGTKTTADAPRGYGDIGDTWTKAEDGYTALNEAWQAGDLTKVRDIETAMFVRRADAILYPVLNSIVDQRVEAKVQAALQRDLGDVVPEVRRTVEQARSMANRDFALAEIAKLPGLDTVGSLFQETEGPPIVFRGVEYPDTPMNRVFAENPDLLDIRVTHDSKGRPLDPQKAEQATFIKRYKQAARIHQMKQQGIDPKKANELVRAGEQVNERRNADRTRQALNSGAGATGRGADKGSDSYVKGLMQVPGEVPFSDLFS